MKSPLAIAQFQRVHLWLCLIGLGSTSGLAQPVLRVFGSEGPSFAVQEAATAFGQKTRCTVEVVSGPPDAWLARAAGSADLIYASAEHMMTDLIREEALQVDPTTVTPLYLRPSAVLVRPGNPRQIQDFPDLLKPGIRVMVVSGSGQTGLWEDMAGKKGDIRTVRAFRKNVVHFATDSTEAMRLWKEKPDIDAWVTWDTWQKPLHRGAQVVPVTQDYVIYRQCSIALTRRGKAQPLAAEFVAFLISPEGEAIFASWEWRVGPPPPSPARAESAVP